MISIKGLNKADVLRVLYNNTKPLGMGFLHYDPKDMTKEEAEEILKARGWNDIKELESVTINKDEIYFDYLKGRVMKVNLTSDTEFNERLYDRDNGTGAAEMAINSLRY